MIRGPRSSTWTTPCVPFTPLFRYIAPVLLVAQDQPASIQALSDAIDRHQAWLAATCQHEAIRDQRARYRLRRLLEIRCADFIAAQDRAFFSQPIQDQIGREHV